MTDTETIDGHCHCGVVSVRAELTGDPIQYSPRACDCDFCRMHNAAYLSDPAGRLRIGAGEPAAIGRYRQGAGLAEMLFCTHCGVLVGVCYETGDGLVGAANARVLPGPFAAETSVSPKTLGPEEKTGRWQELWFRDVQVS